MGARYILHAMEINGIRTKHAPSIDITTPWAATDDDYAGYLINSSSSAPTSIFSHVSTPNSSKSPSSRNCSVAATTEKQEFCSSQSKLRLLQVQMKQKKWNCVLILFGLLVSALLLLTPSEFNGFGNEPVFSCQNIRRPLFQLIIGICVALSPVGQNWLKTLWYIKTTVYKKKSKRKNKKEEEIKGIGEYRNDGCNDYYSKSSKNHNNENFISFLKFPAVVGFFVFFLGLAIAAFAVCFVVFIHITNPGGV